MGGFPGAFSLVVKQDYTGKKEGGGRFHWLGLSADYVRSAGGYIGRFFRQVPFDIQVNARNGDRVNKPCRFFKNIFFLCSSGKHAGYTF